MTIKNRLNKQVLLLFIIQLPIIWTANCDLDVNLLSVLNQLTHASNLIASNPVLSNNIINGLASTAAVNASTNCTLLPATNISSSNISTINNTLSTEIFLLQSLGTNVQTTPSLIPPTLLKATQLLYLLANNTNLSTQSDLNTTGLNAILLVNTLDTIALQWSLVDSLNGVDTATYTALSGFATGSAGSWSYATNTANTNWLQSIATNITAYCAKLVQLKSLTSFTLSGTLKDIASWQNNVWIIDQQNNAIVQLSSDGTVLSTKTITTSNSGARNITSSGNTLYFIEEASRKIGALSSSGALTELSLGTQLTLTADASGVITLTDAYNNVLSTATAGWYTPSVGGTTNLTFYNGPDSLNYLTNYTINGDVITVTASSNGDLSLSDNQGNATTDIAGGVGITTFTHTDGAEPITINAAANGTISFYIDLGSVAVPTAGSSTAVTLHNPGSSMSCFSCKVANNVITISNDSGTLSFSDSNGDSISGTMPATGGTISFYDGNSTGNTLTITCDGTTISGRIMLGSIAIPGNFSSTTALISPQGSLSDSLTITASPLGIISATDSFGSIIGTIPNGGGSVTFTAFDSSPTSNILVGPDARLWFGAFASSSSQAVLKAINTSSNAISEYVIGTSIGSITSIAVSPGGTSLWLVTDTGKLIKVNANGNIIASQTLDAGANSIIVGPDNNLWIGKTNNQIEVRTPSGSTVQSYTTSAAPQQLLKDSNNTVWFTEPGYIGKITAQRYFVQIPTSTTAQVYLTQGPDSNPWFTDPTTKTVCRIIS